jgi:hypothetical protein
MTIKRNFQEFYKIQVNVLKLYDTNRLHVLYKSGSPFPYINQHAKLSQEIVSVLIDLFDTNIVNYTVLKRCNEKDIAMFESFIQKSGASLDLKYMRVDITTEDLVDRFSLLQSAVIAGNDSILIIDELIGLIQKLVKKNRISKNDASELIIDLL